MRFDRRKLLQWVPPGLAALFVPGRAAAGERAEEEASTDRQLPAPTLSYDVAIVGGGVAGAYVAYRLLQATEADFEPNSPLLAILRQKQSLNVGLFEYSGRIGGRLLSAEVPLPGKPDSPLGGNHPAPRRYAEFGGFRFQEQMHIVRDLAKHLDLEWEPFPVDEPPENFLLLRGERFRRCELNRKKAPFPELPYRFNALELEIVRNQHADEGNPDLSTYVANQAFGSPRPDGRPYLRNGPGYVSGLPNGYYTLRKAYHAEFQRGQKTNDPAAWRRVTEIRQQYEKVKQEVVVAGRPLTEWSWWALMSHFLSNEAIAFLEDSGGYNSLWSVGNVSTNLREDFYFANETDVFGKGGSKSPCTDTVWKHITSGYSDIPNRMARAFAETGGKTFLNHQLLRFDRASGGGYDLQFFQRESGTLTSGQAEARCAADPQSCRTVHARHLVLAIPKRSLELLDPTTFFLQEPTVYRLLISSVLDNPALRMFMAYREPWWKKAPPLDKPAIDKACNVAPTCGRSTTDLPVRQFYYWYTAPDGAANQESFVLATYSNAEAERFWHALQEGAALDDLPGTVHNESREDGAEGHGPRAATRTMARLAHRQLMQVVGVSGVPEPYYAHFQNWTKDPWGAGWHAWTAGNNDDALIPRIFQPLPEETVYVCGECWSNVQGWVQGALNTSEVVLQNQLGLKPPSWLTLGGTWLGPGSKESTI